jgi:GH24 family phage-related lysozyme (muramidase)
MWRDLPPLGASYCLLATSLTCQAFARCEITHPAERTWRLRPIRSASEGKQNRSGACVSHAYQWRNSLFGSSSFARKYLAVPIPASNSQFDVVLGRDVIGHTSKSLGIGKCLWNLRLRRDRNEAASARSTTNLSLLHFHESTAASQAPLLCHIGNGVVTKMEKGAQEMFIRSTSVLQCRASQKWFL